MTKTTAAGARTAISLNGICNYCGRDFSGELSCCECPDDDCPSNCEEVGKLRPHECAALAKTGGAE